MISVLEFSGDWDDFFAHVEAGKTLYGDPCEWLQDWSDNRDKGQILFLNYEDVKEDPLAQIKRVVAFFKLDTSETRMQQIVRDTSIDQMKDVAAFAYPGGKLRHNVSIVRTGQIGDWKQYFTKEQNDWFDEKYKKSYESLGTGTYYQ